MFLIGNTVFLATLSQTSSEICFLISFLIDKAFLIQLVQILLRILLFTFLYKYFLFSNLVAEHKSVSSHAQFKQSFTECITVIFTGLCLASISLQNRMIIFAVACQICGRKLFVVRWMSCEIFFTVHLFEFLMFDVVGGD